MNLKKLIQNYDINNDSMYKFHQDLLIYYDFSITPVLSIETERKMLNDREVAICQEYNINYSTFLSNLKLLTQYKSSIRDCQ